MTDDNDQKDASANTSQSGPVMLPPAIGMRAIAIAFILAIAASTFMPWFNFAKSDGDYGFGDIGIHLPKMTIDQEQHLSIYGGALGQGGGYAMSFKGAPIIGYGIVGLSIVCALIAACGSRWSALFLAPVPIMIYKAIENKIQYPGTPWNYGFGVYICGLATIIAFISCLFLLRRRAPYDVVVDNGEELERNANATQAEDMKPPSIVFVDGKEHVSFSCAKCFSRISFRIKYSGMMERCPKCNERLMVPSIT